MTNQNNAPIVGSPATSAHAKPITFSDALPTENSSTTQTTYAGSVSSATTEQLIAELSSRSYKDDSMDIEAIAKAIEGADLTPREVSEYESRLSGWFARKRVLYGRLEALSAIFFKEHRGGYKTVSEVERAWDATAEGQECIRIKRECEAIDKLIDAIRTQWFLLQVELKKGI